MFVFSFIGTLEILNINLILIYGMSDTDRKEHCSALVPYVKPMLLREFSSDYRNVTIGGRVFRLRQNWQKNGIAGVIWDSGIALARYISEHPELVANRTVLELGAGLGLPSIILTYHDAKLIHVTDRVNAISLLEENVRQNANNDCEIQIFAFDWNIDQPRQKYQVILGADLIYGGITFEPLMKFLRDASDHETVVYLSSKIRYQRDKDFYDQLLREHFDVREIFYETEFAVNIFEIRKLTKY
ncbi:unnamed protein product [Litomosoides sigmodontis]|uniref:Methyltransferase small domain-containing protein n=1 Tax=Litomosoides sigmodontis TaxID=42156 RepID=A0A3P6SRY9_LITSI|nr:unnamed protein product [Litomosoides sigmodontis]